MFHQKLLQTAALRIWSAVLCRWGEEGSKSLQENSSRSPLLSLGAMLAAPVCTVRDARPYWLPTHPDNRRAQQLHHRSASTHIHAGTHTHKWNKQSKNHFHIHKHNQLTVSVRRIVWTLTKILSPNVGFLLRYQDLSRFMLFIKLLLNFKCKTASFCPDWEA